MKKRAVALFLTCALTACMLAGCGGQENLTEAEGGTEGNNITEETGDIEKETGIAAGDFSEHVTITAWNGADDYSGYYQDYGDNPVVTYLEEKFNCTIEFQEPPQGSEQDQMSIMLGTQQYTDVMTMDYYLDGVESMYNDGIIRDIAPYVEVYAPNFYNYIQENETRKKTAYDEEGHLFIAPAMSAEEDMLWGGLMYRYDILETMTGGNVAFPSGARDPETIEDMEYMLELMKQYFEGAGMEEYACLIIPYCGYFSNGELLDGFGTSGTTYVDENGKVQLGLVGPEFYNYLVKMHEWYEKGYIYPDFASRAQDSFFLPNTALTYGGAAGCWWGLSSSQLGTSMSMPEYGLNMNVRPMTGAPLDTATREDNLGALIILQYAEDRDSITSGWVVSTNCSDESMIRWLQIVDYLFTEEGGMLKTYGLNAEQAVGSEVYEEMGLTDGAYTLGEDGSFTVNPILDPAVGEGVLAGNANAAKGIRLPGLYYNKYVNMSTREEEKEADQIWASAGWNAAFPKGASKTPEEGNQISTIWNSMSDYINSMVPKFIMGTEELNEETYAAYEAQIESLGLEELLELRQATYDRYMEK